LQHSELISDINNNIAEDEHGVDTSEPLIDDTENVPQVIQGNIAEGDEEGKVREV
jgi:hypothetical protein